MSAPVIRILSDIHFGDPGTSVDRLESLAPLLDGADQLIVNGDALDSQIIADGPAAIAEIRDFFSARVPQLTFITGNHDPDISDVHEIFLNDGAIWVTHGDVFFDNVAPWGRMAPELQRRIRAQPEFGQPGEMQKLETRFRVFRRVCLKLPREHDPSRRGFWAKAHRILRATFPPTRVLHMMKIWRATPGIVDGYAASQRPRSQFVVAGHTHHPGIWRRPSGRVILNTGCFCPPRGGFVVEISGGRLRARGWKKLRGEYRLDAVQAEFPVTGAVAPASLRSS